MTTQFRNVRIEEFEQLKSLFEDYYGVNYCEVDRTYFDWLHRTNPAAKPFIGEHEFSAFGCFKSGQLVSCINYVPFEFFYEERIWRGCWSVGWRRHDGEGIVAGLQLKKHLNNFDIYMSMGATEWVKTIYESKFGFEYLHNIERMIIVLDYYQTKDLLEKRVQLLSGETLILKRMFEAVESSSSSAFFEIDLRSHVEESYWKDHLARAEASCARSLEWMRWRYLDHPHLSYTVLSADKHGMSGLCVVRLDEIRNLPFKVMRVLDFLPTFGNEEMLASAVVNYGKSQGVAFADFFCGSRKIAETLPRVFVGSSDHRALDFPRLFFPLEWRERWSINASMKARDPKLAKLGIADLYFTKSDPSQDILLNREYVTRSL